MKSEKNSFWLTPFNIIWGVNIILFAIISLLVATHLIARVWLFVPLVLMTVVLYDTLQNKHTLRKNYPLIGRVRYLLESFRPEIRQYFFEGELDGKPFNRRQRSIVYQRAKNEKRLLFFRLYLTISMA